MMEIVLLSGEQTQPYKAKLAFGVGQVQGFCVNLCSMRKCQHYLSLKQNQASYSSVKKYKIFDA